MDLALKWSSFCFESAIVSLLRQAKFTSIKVSYKDFLAPNTPDFLIKPLCLLGQVFERLPLLQLLAQSLFISAEKQ